MFNKTLKILEPSKGIIGIKLNKKSDKKYFLTKNNILSSIILNLYKKADEIKNIV